MSMLNFEELEEDLKILDTWGGDQKQIEAKHGAPLWELRRALKFSKPAPAPVELEVADVQILRPCMCFSHVKVKCGHCDTEISNSNNYCPHCGFPIHANILNREEKNTKTELVRVETGVRVK